MQHAARVGSGGVVIDGPEIAEIVEGQLLRIAQAGAEDFQVATIGFAAQHAAGVRDVQHHAFAIGHAHATVAEAEVDAPVVPANQPVNIVPADADVNAEAGGHGIYDCPAGGD